MHAVMFTSAGCALLLPNRPHTLSNLFWRILPSTTARPDRPLNAACARAVRALKMHGGGPPVVAGKPLDHAYTDENVDLLKKVNSRQHGCGWWVG